MNPLVSVIMGVHEKNDYLIDAINSILEQTLNDLELIIVANGCSDELVSFLEIFSDPRIKLYRTDVPQLSFNLNYALNLSKADLVARMDSDDIAHPDRLLIQYNHLLQNPEVSVLGTAYEVIDSNNNVVREVTTLESNSDIRSHIYFENPFCHPTVMFRKSSVLNVGGYLGGKMSEDYGLWLRMARNEKYLFRNLNQLLLKYRIHSSQARGHRLGYAESAGLVLTEFLLKPSLNKFIGFIISSLKISRAK